MNGHRAQDSNWAEPRWNLLQVVGSMLRAQLQWTAPQSQGLLAGVKGSVQVRGLPRPLVRRFGWDPAPAGRPGDRSALCKPLAAPTRPPALRDSESQRGGASQSRNSGLRRRRQQSGEQPQPKELGRDFEAAGGWAGHR